MSSGAPPPLSTSVPSATAAGGAPSQFRYRVFLSYSHADSKWAVWLMRRLESYRVPGRLQGRPAPIGPVGARLAPVFRDRDELPSASDLGETIRGALQQSATLVVICSPASAKSRWVQEEIVTFKRLRGEAHVFAFIVDGEPHAAQPDRECFSPALRFALGSDGQPSGTPAEHIAADARPQADGRDDAFIRLIAGLLGVGFDDLRRRELQRRHRRMTLIATGTSLGMALTIGLATFAWQARNDARRRQEQAEDLLGFMLVDLRLQLNKLGRLDLLEAVGDKAMTYVSSLGARDLNATTLSGKVKALTVIGVVRVSQARYPEALAALEEAHALATAIQEQRPRDANVLFDRAQAEYWIGDVYYRRGDITQARTWFTYYRDTSVALAGVDPANVRWQREAVSGHHNLAVLEFERGNLAAARNGFLGELAVLEKMAMAKTAEKELRASIANVVSFLGSAAERSGAYREALARFEQQAAIMETLIAEEPRTVQWKDRLASACALQGSVLAIVGRRAAAIEQRQRARALLAPLLSADPSNRAYQRSALKLRLQLAMLQRAEGDQAGAQRLVEAARTELDDLARVTSGDRRIMGLVALAWRIEAELGESARRPDAASSAASAIALGETLVARDQADDEMTGDLLSACVVAGRIAQRNGDHPAATRHWQRVVDTLQPRLSETNNWRLLDPAARALACLGQWEASRNVVARLQQLGYQPLEPWPDSVAGNPPAAAPTARSQ